MGSHALRIATADECPPRSPAELDVVIADYSTCVPSRQCPVAGFADELEASRWS